MILLELDPNIVKPGWTPFLITIGLAAVMYLLFRSMRRQFRRVDVNYGVPAEAGDADRLPASEQARSEQARSEQAQPADLEAPPAAGRPPQR